MDDDCRNHDRSELLTDCERIEALEDDVRRLIATVASLTQQLILVREDEPRQIAAAVKEAIDVIDVAMADLRQRVEDRLSEFARRVYEAELAFGIHGQQADLRMERSEARLAALEASDKQTVRHGMDNDTDLADIKRRLFALERQQPPDLNAEQVAYIVGLGGGIAWGGTE